jgi:hypothetical protein
VRRISIWKKNTYVKGEEMVCHHGGVESTTANIVMKSQAAHPDEEHSEAPTIVVFSGEPRGDRFVDVDVIAVLQ